jgi:hypothetical protein
MGEALASHSEGSTWRRPLAILLAAGGILSLASDVVRQEQPSGQEPDRYYAGTIFPKQDEVGAQLNLEVSERHGIPGQLRFLVEEGCKAYRAYQTGDWPTYIEGERPLLARGSEVARMYNAIQAKALTEGFADTFADEARRYCSDVSLPDYPRFEG